jgi:hypothetical protein
VFSLRKKDKETKKYLKFLCGYLNSELVTFYAQKREIIRYRKGKQPQIKISDLYSIPIPEDFVLIEEMSDLVENFYMIKGDKAELETSLNKMIYNFYDLSSKEIGLIKESISDFLKS